MWPLYNNTLKISITILLIVLFYWIALSDSSDMAKCELKLTHDDCFQLLMRY